MVTGRALAHARRRRELARAPGSGFTLIELLVVMTLIALLLSIAVPRYSQALDAGRVKVQQQDLSVMRDAIDKYYGDLGRYPDSLDDLVARHHLRTLPVDPVAGNDQWATVAPTDGTAGRVFDVKPAVGVADTVP